MFHKERATTYADVRLPYIIFHFGFENNAASREIAFLLLVIKEQALKVSLQRHVGFSVKQLPSIQQIYLHERLFRKK